MRALRYKVAEEGVYFLRTGLTDGLVDWEEGERKYLWGLLERVADFSGVELLERVVLGREVLLLVAVAPWRGGDQADGELVRRHRRLYGESKGFLGMTTDELEAALAGPRAVSVRGRLLARMHDISPFMKTLKQRFSVWYNQRHDRRGTLWRDRFESSLLENREEVLAYYRAYLRTAPVRAEEVEAPGEYRWSSAYGAGREWWRVLSPRQTRALSGFTRTLEKVMDDLLLYPSLRGRGPADPRAPTWPEHLCRGGIVGTEPFVRHHTTRWRGRDTSVPLRDLSADARLRAARSHRRRGSRSPGPAP